MNATREFLSKVLPWEMAGPNVFFNLHWKQPGYHGTPNWGGRAYTSLDDLVIGVRTWSKPNMDLYICMSAQSQCQMVPSKNGGKPYPKAVRVQANVVAIKSFFVDVDVKEKAYKTQQEALDAFELFITAVDLPLPTVVVGSGSGGFHAHWVVDRPMLAEEWQPLAYALAEATRKFGLICDSQCTIDSARILRIPGTLNFKGKPPSPVTLISSGAICDLDDIKAVLAPYVGLTPVGNSAFSPFPFDRRQPTIDGAELSDGIVLYETTKPSIYSVAEECPFLGDTIMDGGASNSNPSWFMSLQAAVHSKEGRDAAHVLSQGHEDYTPEETDREFDRLSRDQKERNIGWPSCHKIHLSGAEQCAGCPHIGLGKSPFHFFVPEAPPLIPIADVAPGTPRPDIWPDKYVHAADGFVYTNIIDEQGTPKPVKVMPYQISNGWLQDNPWVLHFTCRTNTGKDAKIEVPLADLGGMGGARKCLAENGIVLNKTDYTRTEDFILAWIQKLQQQKDSVVSSSPFGWSVHKNGEIEGFTYAGKVWCQDSDRPAAQDDAEMYETFSPHGSAQPWIDAAKVITDQERPALNAILAASFAAPLMRFSGHDGLLIAGWSGATGIGKSSASLVAQAVWGHSVKGRQGLSDTSNSVFRKMGKLKSLPVFWDEMQTEEQLRRVGEMVFDLSRGTEKSRLKADLTQRQRETWQTLMVMVANYSMVGPISGANKSHSAGLMRLFEWEIDKPLPGAKGQIEVSRATRMIAKVAENYGHAGLIYAQFLGANYGRINKDIAAMLMEHEKRLGARQEERYWSTAVTLLTVATRYSNELGLTKINIGQLEDFLIKTFYQMRETVKDSPADMSNSSSVSNLLAQFLNAMRQRHTLVTNRIHVGQGKPAKGAVTIMSDLTKLDAIYVHIGSDDRMMRMSSTYLSKWLTDQKEPRHAFIKALEEEFGFKKTNGILGGGTSASTNTKEYLLEIQLDSPKLLGFIATE